MEKFSEASRAVALLAVAGALNGGKLIVFDGPLPDLASDALTADNHVLVTYNPAGGIQFEATADADGNVAKSAGQVWSGTVVRNGTPSFYRIVTAADAGTASDDTAVRVQGTAGTSALDDLVLTSATMASGATETIQAFVLTATSG